jgi:hypothetical protein
LEIGFDSSRIENEWLERLCEREGTNTTMTYEKLFELKYKKRLSTYELLRRFPDATEQVADVALMDVPEPTLKEIMVEEKEYHRLMRLKKRFSSFL